MYATAHPSDMTGCEDSDRNVKNPTGILQQRELYCAAAISILQAEPLICLFACGQQPSALFALHAKQDP